MIVSFVARDKLVHARYISAEDTPYVLNWTEAEIEAWCMCAARFRGFVMKHVEPLTCLACLRMVEMCGNTWCSMVIE